MPYGFLCFTSDSSGSNCEISREVGVPVCEAFVEADKVWRDFYFFESEVTNENEQYFFHYVVLTKTYQPSLQGNFDKAVEILKPLRYKINLLGGSRAQVRKC